MAQNPFAAKALNPFAANPLSRAEGVTLLEVPAVAPEHEPRQPLKTYLTKGSGGLDGLLDALSGGGAARRRPLSPAVPRPPDDTADLEAADPLEAQGGADTPPPPPPPPAIRWGRK